MASYHVYLMFNLDSWWKYMLIIQFWLRNNEALKAAECEHLNIESDRKYKKQARKKNFLAYIHGVGGS